MQRIIIFALLLPLIHSTSSSSVTISSLLSELSTNRLISKSANANHSLTLLMFNRLLPTGNNPNSSFSASSHSPSDSKHTRTDLLISSITSLLHVALYLIEYKEMDAKVGYDFVMHLFEFAWNQYPLTATCNETKTLMEAILERNYELDFRRTAKIWAMSSLQQIFDIFYATLNAKFSEKSSDRECKRFLLRVAERMSGNCENMRIESITRIDNSALQNSVETVQPEFKYPEVVGRTNEFRTNRSVNEEQNSANENKNVGQLKNRTRHNVPIANTFYIQKNAKLQYMRAVHSTYNRHLNNFRVSSAVDTKKSFGYYVCKAVTFTRLGASATKQSATVPPIPTSVFLTSISINIDTEDAPEPTLCSLRRGKKAGAITNLFKPILSSYLNRYTSTTDCTGIASLFNEFSLIFSIFVRLGFNGTNAIEAYANEYRMFRELLERTNSKQIKVDIERKKEAMRKIYCEFIEKHFYLQIK